MLEKTFALNWQHITFLLDCFCVLHVFSFYLLHFQESFLQGMFTLVIEIKCVLSIMQLSQLCQVNPDTGNGMIH